jgi:transposase
MAISQETLAQILRLHHVEKWRPCTIARQLGVHHTTVTRALYEVGGIRPERSSHPSVVDPYRPFILETLEKWPSLPASRLFQMVSERGYPGREDHFRHHVALLRPRKPAEAFMRLRTLPGEQGQVDWAFFGKITCGRAVRLLMAFVMVLSYSRRIFLKFFTDSRMGAFLAGHVAAFNHFGGVPRVELYDNLKSAVLERKGEAIRFHPTLLELAAHYRYEPRPVAVARGNEKGRVERAIRYARTSFFPARTFTDLADLNRQALAWCTGPADLRTVPDERTLTVREAFDLEQPKLLPLPGNEFPAEDRLEVRVGKTPYARFDLNDYSVPHDRVRRTLTLSATTDRVRLLDDGVVVAEHPRSFDRDQQIEDPGHIAALVERKREARTERGIDRLRRAVPSSAELLTLAAQRGNNLGGTTTALLRLLDEFGAEECEAAVAEAVARNAPHPHSVRLSLDRRRSARNLQPPVEVVLPDDRRVRELTVSPHDLRSYDALREVNDDRIG